MKKLPKISILILAISAIIISLFSAKTYALYIDSDDATWYTVAELLDYREQVEREKNELCGDSQSCREAWFYEKIETDQKFQALNNLEQRQFIVTAINLKTKTFKIISFSENMMLKRMGIEEKINVSSFYLARFTTEQAFNRAHDLESQQNELYNGVVPGVQTLFAYRRIHDNEVFPSASNIEVELEMLPNSDVASNPFGAFGYVVDGVGYNAVGYVFYQSCLDAKDYTEGAECRLMFSPEKGAEYFPYVAIDGPTDSTPEAEIEPEDISTPITPEPTQISSEPTAITPELTPIIPEPAVIASIPMNPVLSIAAPREYSGSTTLATAPLAQDATVLSSDQIEIPNLGKTCPEERIIKFPWWLIILMLIGDAAVLWLFWPKNTKKS